MPAEARAAAAGLRRSVVLPLEQHRERARVTAGVRLNRVRDALAIPLRQLATAPLDLSHRPAPRAAPAASGAGLAGTIGAERLAQAAHDPHAALGARDHAVAAPHVDAVAIELDRVLADVSAFQSPT